MILMNTPHERAVGPANPETKTAYGRASIRAFRHQAYAKPDSILNVESAHFMKNENWRPCRPK